MLDEDVETFRAILCDIRYFCFFVPTATLTLLVEQVAAALRRFLDRAFP